MQSGEIDPGCPLRPAGSEPTPFLLSSLFPCVRLMIMQGQRSHSHVTEMPRVSNVWLWAIRDIDTGEPRQGRTTYPLLFAISISPEVDYNQHVMQRRSNWGS